MNQTLALAPERAGSPTLDVTLARRLRDIHDAQRLRYQVFVEEMGARIETPIPGVEYDRYDRHCRHLLVRDSVDGRLVGYTRLLTGDRAARAGGFYSESEFDMTAMLALPGRFLEIGRTCIHPDYRNGATITALWSGLARVVADWRIDYLIGCASIPLGATTDGIWAVYRQLADRYLVDAPLRVVPRQPVPVGLDHAMVSPALPPLLKGYLRVGARIGGEPYLDADFGVADLFILVATANLERRYARHFLKDNR